MKRRFLPAVLSSRKVGAFWRRLHLHRDDGQVLVLWALVSLVVLGIAGLGVNLGVVYYKKGQLQSAVDAAALAGAQTASKGGSASSSQSLILNNAPGASGTVSLNTTNPSEVVATATQTVSGGFAALFGFPKFSVSARAVASYGPGEAFNYALFSGSPTSNLQIGGTVKGSVHSNDTISISGGTTITGDVNATGAINVPSYEAPQFKLSPHQPSLPMPQWNVPSPPTIAAIPAPPSGVAPSSTTVTVTNTAVNAVYATSGASVRISNSEVSQGGVYISGGGSLTDSGGGTNSIRAAINGDIVVSGGGSVNIGGGIPVNGSIYVTGGGSVTLQGDVNVSGGIYVSGGGSISVGGGDSVGALPSSAFPGHNPVGIFNDGGYGVTNASITVAGSSNNVDIAGDVIDVGSHIDISGGINVNGNILATEGNGSSSSGITYGGGGSVTGYVIDQGGSISLGGSTTSGAQPGLTVADFPYNHQGTEEGGAGITIGGGGTFTGVLYAPNGSISLGSNQVIGSVVGQSLSLGWTNVTYDAAVVDKVPFQTISLIQ
ncbi:pilus assembly protein TadG-related protein [Alicyclobacillus sp. ALC3]|uniref:pilus assembly protein TadG-related protein n=1 Tax=Alicyclobacillus sp. ALC3 TaxID=2796143 RepID=UPI0023789CE2|nr:pilus assembly protein TadG-related protein [Alicyclobacillus sp. ALC3]WDL95312.1 hypothetical protein JC200_12885 [Alicyclobacillus sp. ALC3]